MEANQTAVGAVLVLVGVVLWLVGARWVITWEPRRYRGWACVVVGGFMVLAGADMIGVIGE